MGAIRFVAFKEAWVDSDIGTITTALVASTNAKLALIDILKWEGSRIINLDASGVDFTYDKFNELKALFDAYSTANGIDIRIMNWSA